MQILSKVVMILLIIITILNLCSNTIYAAVEININKAYIQTIGNADNHLKYYREHLGRYTYHTTILTGYKDKDGTTYPVYCMDRLLPGADEGEYYVTIDNLLDNNKIWRVIKNGYPYKTAKDWGLTDDKNVYAITRFAIYCVTGQTKLEYFKAEEDDKEAVAMLKALKKLVDIGENGTEKQEDNPLTTSKVGKFKENGKYYTQEYKVSSTSDFNKYKIKKTTGMPEGSYIADEKGNKQTTFEKGENFVVMIPKTSLTKDIDIDIKISAECKAYVVLEGKTTVSGTQNYVVTAGEYATITTKINLEEKVDTGKIIINKIDKEDKTPIEGVEFELKNEKGKKVATAITDSKGIAKFENLIQGKYTLIETKTNQNYILSNESNEINVEYNKTTTLEKENEYKKGSLKVYKVDKDNQKIVLGNIKFDLYSEKEQKVIGTYQTDENGEIYIENLKIGNYKLQEKSTNKWYNLANETEIKVKWNETTEATIENELKKGRVKVIKVDSEDNQIKLEGVKFNVLDENKNILETITTNEKGEAYTSKYAIRDYNKILLQEISTNEQYILDDKIIEVQLKSNKTSEVQLENKYKRGNLKIHKVDKDNKERVIENVEFDLYSEKDKKVIGTYKTDKNGEIYVEKLKIGEYKLKEKSTNKWYNLADDTKVNINWNETTEVTIENELKKGKAKIIKVDSEDNQIKLEGVKFNVLDKNRNILETIITDKNGEAYTSQYGIKDYQKIYLQEISTNEKYVLDDKLVEVELKIDETPEVKIENKKIKGQIKIIKTSKDDNKVTKEKAGTPLEGVEFEIYDINNNFIEKVITNKNGIGITSKLEKGIYKIKEVSTKEWYYINEETAIAEIIQNNQILEVEIKNESKNPEAYVEKVGVDKAEVGSEIEYDISVKNSGNTGLEKFTLIDKIPSEYINVTKFQTGTYNQKLQYNLYYKTNFSNDEYILLMEGLDTQENYEIDFQLELADNESITEIKLEFNTVDIGFCSNENPHIFANIKQDVKSESTFTNMAKVSGEYNGYKVLEQSKWKTFAYKLLPKTGC